MTVLRITWARAQVPGPGPAKDMHCIPALQFYFGGLIPDFYCEGHSRLELACLPRMKKSPVRDPPWSFPGPARGPRGRAPLGPLYIYTIGGQMLII